MPGLTLLDDLDPTGAQRRMAARTLLAMILAGLVLSRTPLWPTQVLWAMMAAPNVGLNLPRPTPARGPGLFKAA